MTNQKKFLRYDRNQLTCDGVPFAELAEEFGTPLFVYSASAIRDNYRRISRAFASAKPLVAYSVKANSNGAIVRILRDEGSGFDIVSANEMDRVLMTGVSADRMIFAGVGKTADEMRRALKAGVREFNVESPAEAARLNDVAASIRKIAPVAIRINPEVDARTHRHITTGKKENKFGMSLDAARKLISSISKMPGLRLEGLHAHIGSQILSDQPHEEAVGVVDKFIGELVAAGHPLRTLNFGGGFGIAYHEEEKALDLRHVAKIVCALAKKHGLELILEPGRSIIGPAGVFLTRVEYVKYGKSHPFVIVDGAMTEMIRPALYDAYHEIRSVKKSSPRSKRVNVDVVGPVCESGDFLALQRELTIPESGDLLAVLDAGAYCSVMSSNYNSRPRPAEVLVDDGEAHLVRRRETKRDLYRHEVVPAHLE